MSKFLDILDIVLKQNIKIINSVSNLKTIRLFFCLSMNFATRKYSFED